MGSAWFLSPAILPMKSLWFVARTDPLAPRNRVHLICDPAPSLSVSPLFRVWFVALSDLPAPHRGWGLKRGLVINMWPRCPAVTKHLHFLFFYYFLSGQRRVFHTSYQIYHRRIKRLQLCPSTFLIYDICILNSSSWHLDDKLTLFAVALQSMN